MSIEQVLKDYISGVVLGNTTDVVGLPIDIINETLRPLGLATEKPVLGSRFLRELFNQTPEVNSVAEFAGTTVGLGAVAKAVMLPAIVRQHGTARKFTEFSKDFYMSGEGAQAFGEGVYTTDKLGKHYAEVAFNANKAKAEKASGELSALEWQLAERFKPGRKSDLSPQQVKNIQERVKLLKQEQKQLMEGVSKYLVEVKTPAGDWLDWDKPNPELIKKYKGLQLLGINETMTGKQVYSKIKEKYPQVSPSEILSRLGIKGHVYLDQVSRKTGKGTTNQVTYNPEEVKIISTKEIK